MKFDNQLRYATRIIDAYKGEMPLYVWLKNFFREHPQMGSRDRKQLSNLVYGFYRLGHTLRDTPIPDRLLAGLFLCSEEPSPFLQHFCPAWIEKITLPLTEKITFFQRQPSGSTFRVEDIFPWKSELSDGIDHRAFCLSFLRQPDLFLRIRPTHQQAVLAKLAAGPSPHPASRQSVPAAPCEFIPPFTLRLPNGFKVEDYFTPDHQVVIQDYSSQRLASFLQPLPDPSAPPPAEAPLSFWDACAASGGKSILAYDLYPSIGITVSDIRESILHNLRQRFQQAGIKKYRTILADLTQGLPPALLQPGHPAGPSLQQFDLTLADAPCTGSGTWSRTPEELYFFDPRKILHYSGMQTRILSHIAANLAPDTWLVYSTCSVFKKENEEMVSFLKENFGLQPDRMENITGYDQRADSMFAARFRR